MKPKKLIYISYQLFLLFQLFGEIYGEELCSNLVCGKGAIKTIAVSDMTSCHCACPKFHQGDANIECKAIPCGVVEAEAEVDTRYIVGGSSQAQKSRWPWIATIGFWENDEWRHQCGGSLITHHHVITAANCTLEMHQRDLVVQFEAFNLSNYNNENWTERQIKKIEIHPEFDVTSKAAYYDVAILTLKDPIKFSHNIRPVCLPTSASNDFDNFRGKLLSVSGWGKADFDSRNPSEILKIAHVNVFKQSHCLNLYKKEKFGVTQKYIRIMFPQWFKSHIMCAGIPGERDGTCKGDSGGPLIQYIDDENPHYILQGVVQGGIRCENENLPGIYTRLADESIFQFITETSGLATTRRAPAPLKKMLAVSAFSISDSFFDVEVVNLDDSTPNAICNDLPQFPVGGRLNPRTGQLFKGTKPIICGGEEVIECYELNERNWKKIASPSEILCGGQMTKLTYPNGTEVLLLMGGFSKNLTATFSSTVEFFDGSTWEKNDIAEMPQPVTNHCSVKINETALLILGGYTKIMDTENITSHTFFYNLVENRWSPGPELNLPRYIPGCGILNWENPLTGVTEKVIVAAAGLDGQDQPLSSVELLFLTEGKGFNSGWVFGPSLPIELSGSTLVEYQNSVIQVGGSANVVDLSNHALYQLSSPHGNWTLMNQELKRGGYYDVAFLIPDELAKCN